MHRCDRSSLDSLRVKANKQRNSIERFSSILVMISVNVKVVTSFALQREREKVGVSTLSLPPYLMTQ